MGWHLEHHHGLRVSVATIARTLTRHGLITPAPNKRPKASYIRFQAEQPNECWQSDFTHYRLAEGTDVEIITWLDDHSRYVLHCSAHTPVTGTIVLASFRQSVATYGIPASTLTDNGMVYTVRFATGRGGRTALEAELARLHVRQKNSRPNHPTTCGKVERFQQTLKKWLRAQPAQPAITAELQALLDRFVDDYNHRRPHSSLPRHATPAAAYQARPKAAPGVEPGTDSHDRVRADRVDSDGKLTLRVNGRLHHIGIGRTHARTPVLMLIHDLDVRIIDATTGELLRELTIDPNRDYQSTGKDRYARWRQAAQKPEKTDP
ncbi:MAG TPA: DDE-type integrase/transposase/recombinase [Jatrophihabitans sp.]|nr:DDE-type integrase/transposase/recombinase [Jatrophihabitans sp.]